MAAFQVSAQSAFCSGDCASKLGLSIASPALSLCVLIPRSGAQSDMKPHILLLPGVFISENWFLTAPVYKSSTLMFFSLLWKNVINDRSTCRRASDPPRCGRLSCLSDRVRARVCFIFAE